MLGHMGVVGATNNSSHCSDAQQLGLEHHKLRVWARSFSVLAFCRYSEFGNNTQSRLDDHVVLDQSNIPDHDFTFEYCKDTKRDSKGNCDRDKQRLCGRAIE